MRAVLRGAGRWIGGLAAVLAHLWCVGAIWYLGTGTSWPFVVLAVGFGIALPAAWFRWRPHRRRLLLGLIGAVVLLFLLGLLKQPATDRNWTPDMARAPAVEIEGDTVRIKNVRDCDYRTDEDFDVHWREATFDLAQLERLDFLVERFHAWDFLAHTALSFGFTDGRQLVISVELRREVGEGFHPIAGIYRQFELFYVIGTERDLLGLRTNHRKSRTWLYPIQTTPERRRAIFVAMLRRADAMGRAPEFYNTLTNSCTTNIVDHVRTLVPGRIPRDLRVLFPGHAAALAHEVGLLDTDLSLDEAMEAYRIDLVAQEGPLDATYSRRIRSRRPEPKD